MRDSPVSAELSDDIALFSERETSIEDIEAAGWSRYYSSSGWWWWRHKSGKRYMPRWVEQLLLQEKKRAVEDVRFTIKQALGINK